MAINLDEVNKVFKQYYQEKFDLATNPDRIEEYKEYCKKQDEEREKRWKLKDEQIKKIAVLPKLEKGHYKIRLINEITNYTTSLGKPGEIIEVYNEGNTWKGGSCNRNQDDRALVYDYGMSGTDNYYPTIDFEIIEYLGKEKKNG